MLLRSIFPFKVESLFPCSIFSLISSISPVISVLPTLPFLPLRTVCYHLVSFFISICHSILKYLFGVRFLCYCRASHHTPGTTTHQSRNRGIRKIHHIQPTKAPLSNQRPSARSSFPVPPYFLFEQPESPGEMI